MEDIQISDYSGKDRSDCINLLKQVYPGTSNEDTFAWRFESLSRPKPIMVCAKHDDRVISFCSWIPWEFTYENEKYIGYEAGAAATDREYRRKGILGRILEFANRHASENDVDFLFCFPGALTYGPTYNAGYCSVGNFTFHVAGISPFKKSNKKKGGDEFIEVPFMSLIESNKLTPKVDRDYSEWRYRANPKEYKFIEYMEDNDCASFVVRRKEYLHKKCRLRINAIVLLDCQFGSFHESFVRNAFNYLKRECSREAFFMVTFFNENTHRGKELVKHFPVWVKSRSRTLCVRPVEGRIDQRIVLNRNNWDIMPHIIDHF